MHTAYSKIGQAGGMNRLKLDKASLWQRRVGDLGDGTGAVLGHVPKDSLHAAKTSCARLRCALLLWNPLPEEGFAL